MRHTITLLALVLAGCATSPEQGTTPLTPDLRSVKHDLPSERIRFEKPRTRVCGEVVDGVVRIRTCAAPQQSP